MRSGNETIHNVGMFSPGLLPIFLHGCEIKSGSGLGTRLIVATASLSQNLAFFLCGMAVSLIR